MPREKSLKYLQAIIFDLDGTLVDSLALQRKALMAACQSTNSFVEPPYDDFFALSGGNLTRSMFKLGFPPEAVDVYRRVNIENCASIKIFPGVHELLSILRRNGVLLGLCTGKDRERTVQVLEATGLNHFWDAIVTGDDTERHKPDPEPIRRTLWLLRARPDHSAYVGDSLNDIKSANGAGVCSMGITWGVSSVIDLMKSKADFVFSSVGELSKFLVSSCVSAGTELNKTENNNKQFIKNIKFDR